MRASAPRAACIAPRDAVGLNELPGLIFDAAGVWQDTAETRDGCRSMRHGSTAAPIDRKPGRYSPQASPYAGSRENTMPIRGTVILSSADRVSSMV